MSFSDLMRDTVSLLKYDGQRIDDIKASVQKNKIFIHRSDILIEPSDLIIRKMSNGGEETFKVIDPGFHEGLGGSGKHSGIPAGYQMDVKKLGIPEAKSAVQTINYNFTGHNNRVNQNSIDNSTNTVNINENVLEHLNAIRTEIINLGLTEQKKKESREIVDAVESQFISGKASKTVVKTLLSALPQVASITNIASLILSFI